MTEQHLFNANDSWCVVFIHMFKKYLLFLISFSDFFFNNIIKFIEQYLAYIYKQLYCASIDTKRLSLKYPIWSQIFVSGYTFLKYKEINIQ